MTTTTSSVSSVPQQHQASGMGAIFFQSLLPKTATFPGKVVSIMAGYFSDDQDRQIVRAYLAFVRGCGVLRSPVDFSDPQVLQQKFSSLSSAELTKVGEVVKSCYEVPQRGIGQNSPFGFAFAMNPEPFAHHLKDVQGKVVLEVAAGGGESGVCLFACAGAKEVYLNELDALEVTRTKELVQKLPSTFAERIQIIPGSCLDIETSHPNLVGRVDLLYCRNFIHFFPDVPLNRFFALFKRLLKPGGEIMCTGNAIYPFSDIRYAFEKDLLATSYSVALGTIYDFSKIADPRKAVATAAFHHDAWKCPANEPIGTQRPKLLFEKNSKTGNSWENTSEFYELPANLQETLTKKFQAWLKQHTVSHGGEVRLWVSNRRVDSMLTLSAFYEKHGLVTDMCFVIKKDGHVVADEQRLFNDGVIVGATARKPK